MRTLAHSEHTYNGKRIIIDAADLNDFGGYIEVMAMSPNGMEVYDVFQTHDEAEALAVYNSFVERATGKYSSDTYTMSDWAADSYFSAKPMQKVTDEVYGNFQRSADTALPKAYKTCGFKGFMVPIKGGKAYMAFGSKGWNRYFLGIVDR